MAHDEWYTPKEVIEPIRKFYGGIIDYDPASCKKANQIIKADSYLNIEGQTIVLNQTKLVYMNYQSHLFVKPHYQTTLQK
jgi:hypothetical protein